MKVGDRVIWIANDPVLVPMQKRIFEGTVTKLGKDTVYVNHQHKAEDQLYASFTWPDTPETRALCADILEQEARHKREGDEMMTRMFKLRNSLNK